ncbi:multidrug effflux MFS transporter [Pseudaestuariivita atlantica]|uniref:Bcr/CflA family efflux transporter n=1 Tax=Pseudaestuariivita atlantica TaxID=1317121 RepID=A0A0L1JLB1_9RHOB|nr:multidrug effflux MFS transporter [Pseudaestuariivita atlantica]KNG92536.1 multidrug MFS transporter [Pseudaestuariivita atlantica]
MTRTTAVRFLDRDTPPHILTLILIAGLSAMTMNVFLPSLPAMAIYFETDYAIVQMSVAIYLGVNAVLQLFIGPISDNLGRRPVLLAGIVIFMLATLGCVLATNVWVFLAFRMAQAAIVVGMVLSRAIARDVSGTTGSASMIAYVTMGMAVVPMIAPAIGGFLDGLFGWQANFWMLFGLGAVTFVICWFDQGETNRASGQSLKAQFADLPELIRSPRFWAYALATAFCSGAFFAYLGGAPFVGTDVFGMSPERLGIFFGAPAVGYFLGNGFSGRHAARYGVNLMVLWGTLISTFGVAVSVALYVAGLGNEWTFFGFMTFVGLGNGLTIPNATAGLLSVRPHLAGTASGMGGAIMVGGGAALSAMAGALVGPGTGPLPLLALMLATSVLGILAILFVYWRERQLRVA